MAIKTFRQGDDAKLQAQVVKTPAIDFSGATEILVALYVEDSLQYRYKLTEESGFGICEVDSVSDDTVNIFVERDHSVSFKTGTVKAYIVAKFADAEFPDGGRTESHEVIVARVNAGKALEEQI